MPDNSSTITILRAAINSGATSASIDGQSTTFRSLSDMREILQGLIDEDTSGEFDDLKKRRPVVNRINLGGAW